MAKQARPQETLTPREDAAARLAICGLSTRSIATIMEIRPQSVRNLLWRACEKVGASNRVELARMWKPPC